jgi:predicted nucleic acid-binding protein
MNESTSIDSNIILYSLDEEDSPKKLIALELIQENPYLSSQSLTGHLINHLHFLNNKF